MARVAASHPSFPQTNRAQTSRIRSPHVSAALVKFIGDSVSTHKRVLNAPRPSAAPTDSRGNPATTRGAATEAAARSRGGDILRISRMHGDCLGTHQIACLSSPLGEANQALGPPGPGGHFFVFQFFRSNLKIAPRLRHSASTTARCPWTVGSGRRHSERFLRCALSPQTHPCAPTVTARDSLVLVSATYNGR